MERNVIKYLKNSQKVYILKRRKRITFWHVFFQVIFFVTLLNLLSNGEKYQIYLAKFDEKYEIIISRKNIILEILKLREEFQPIKKEFICGEYVYRIVEEIM